MKTGSGLAWIALILLAACQTVPSATPVPQELAPGLPPTLAVYLDGALNLLEEHSLYGAQSDWAAIRRDAHAAAAGAQEFTDLYPVLLQAMHATGDRHGYLMPPLQVQAYFEGGQQSLPAARADLLQERIGYLEVPTFVSGDPEVALQFAGQLRQNIASLDGLAVCGWVVDLRYNEGGNGAAMLAGLLPLLEPGILLYYTYVDGRQAAWESRSGSLFFEQEVILDLPAMPSQPSSVAPIAVLTNEVTTSGGEFVAIAMHGWPNTHSFGQETYGRTTAPEGYTLPDGAVFAFSTAYFTDHSGQIYEHGYRPDRVLPASDDPLLRDRSVPREALSWLFSQPACSRP